MVRLEIAGRRWSAMRISDVLIIRAIAGRLRRLADDFEESIRAEETDNAEEVKDLLQRAIDSGRVGC